MTKEERESRIQQILNANGDIPIITEALMAIRDEFDDYDSRWAERNTEREKYIAEAEQLREENRKLKEKNYDLFMRISGDEVKEDQKEDIKEDGENLTFEELFETKERG